MTSPISALGAVNGLSSVSAISGASSAAATTGAGAAGGDFASMLSKGLESVQASQANASDLAVQVANGTLQDPAQYTMAATEASLGLQMTMAIRNKAVEAFQEIMRMQA
ncbi:flagellar hook-basal body complex protein FliE [Winogradskya humida]|uniref:flagellar hook-basal body complex protein FliE n=1 Tax=Winogradskya humida TaxID=113566 RepID=UPI0019417A06|nr:flagellar hook-basal body complex protein FliE [Actinoplanes humidus]